MSDLAANKCNGRGIAMESLGPIESFVVADEGR